MARPGPRRGNLWAKLADPGQLLDRLPLRYSRRFADHVTLQALTTYTPGMQALIGRKVRARVTAEAWDERIQAVRVELSQALQEWCENAAPHVTLSSDGVPPVTSNEMLAGPHQEVPLDFWIDLEVEFQAFGR